ncbi:hypothetical protein [Metabacillus sp. Hm71]|uniref:hypothetical protein n=1 Tax=Metabacillus sp. Hm71 TaxID=3450743 RepID=UPI003F41B763
MIFVGALLASWIVMNLFYIIINPLTRYKRGKTFLYVVSYGLYVILAFFILFETSIYYITAGLLWLVWYIYKDKKKERREVNGESHTRDEDGRN